MIRTTDAAGRLTLVSSRELATEVAHLAIDTLARAMPEIVVTEPRPVPCEVDLTPWSYRLVVALPLIALGLFVLFELTRMFCAFGEPSELERTINTFRALTARG